jgi:hypothetical protein
MNLPIQAPPVMRGIRRVSQLSSPQAANLRVAQSQSLGDLCALCAFAPPPWNLVCGLACPVVGQVLGGGH